jgi:hypothetical protein
VTEELDAIDAGRRQRQARITLRSCGVAAVIIFFVVLIARIHQTPGVEGIFAGFCLGLFAALLVGACGAWTALSLTSPKKTSPFDAKTADELVAALHPVLVELEAARLEVVRQVNTRAMTRVPLGAAAGFGLWCLEQMSGRPDRDGIAGVVWNAVCLVGVGAMAGYYSAVRDSSAAYAHLYLGRVLPLLAARFGDLSFRSPAQFDLGLLTAEGLFDEFDSARSDIEIFGTYRGLATSIVTLVLTSGSGKERRTSFEGLLVEVTLPRKLSATTAVIAGTGAFGSFRDRLRTGDRQRVELEDPRFAASYDVWSTDQIAARALLTPAFMERLLALRGSESSIDGRPLVLGRDNRLTLVVPRAGRDHFAVPGFREAAASRTALIALNDHITAVLAIADAVIDLDQAARSVAAESAFRRSPNA